MKNKVSFLSIDANETGKQIEKFIFCEQYEALKNFSSNLTNTINFFDELIQSLGGEVIMAGGDNILAAVSEENVTSIITAVEKINAKEEYRFAIGIGDSASDAYMALKYSKANHIFTTQYREGHFTEIDKFQILG